MSETITTTTHADAVLAEAVDTVRAEMGAEYPSEAEMGGAHTGVSRDTDGFLDDGAEAKPATMTEAEAKAITRKLVTQHKRTREAVAKLVSLIEEARAGKAWDALGFKSMSAYLVATLAPQTGDEPLSPADRVLMVGILRAEGMSLPNIAKALGLSAGTTQRSADKAKAEHGLDNGGQTEDADGNVTKAGNRGKARKALGESLTGLAGKVRNVAATVLEEVRTDARYNGKAKADADAAMRAALDQTIAELTAMRDALTPAPAKAAPAAKRQARKAA